MTPWLSQPLLAVMLCGLAERVLNAASILWMLMSRLSGACHADLSRRSRKAKADVAPHRLPGGNSGIAKEEQQQHVDTDAAARAAVIVAAVVAARATPTRRTRTIAPSSGALIQNEKFPAAPAALAAPAEPTAAAASSTLAAFAQGSGPRL
jgi:hypothetical protein